MWGSLCLALAAVGWGGVASGQDDRPVCPPGRIDTSVSDSLRFCKDPGGIPVPAHVAWAEYDSAKSRSGSYEAYNHEQALATGFCDASAPVVNIPWDYSTDPPRMRSNADLICAIVTLPVSLMPTRPNVLDAFTVYIVDPDTGSLVNVDHVWANEGRRPDGTPRQQRLDPGVSGTNFFPSGGGYHFIERCRTYHFRIRVTYFNGGLAKWIDRWSPTWCPAVQGAEGSRGELGRIQAPGTPQGSPGTSGEPGRIQAPGTPQGSPGTNGGPPPPAGPTPEPAPVPEPPSPPEPPPPTTVPQDRIAAGEAAKARFEACRAYWDRTDPGLSDLAVASYAARGGRC